MEHIQGHQTPYKMHDLRFIINQAMMSFATNIPKKFVVLTELTLGGVSIMGIMDPTLKIISAISALVAITVGWFAIQSYRMKKRLDEIDMKIKEAQLEAIIEERERKRKSNETVL